MSFDRVSVIMEQFNCWNAQRRLVWLLAHMPRMDVGGTFILSLQKKKKKPRLL